MIRKIKYIVLLELILILIMNNTIVSAKVNSNDQYVISEDTEEVVTVKEEQEEATPQFGICRLILKGIKNMQNEYGENIEESTDIDISPTFNIDTYEYTCNVNSDIKRIDIIQDSGIYNENVIIQNLEELKVGENIITIKISKEGYGDLTYRIKVSKEKEVLKTDATTFSNKENEILETSPTTNAIKENEISETTSTAIENKNKKQNNEIIISMSLISFIIMQLLIIVTEIVLIKLVPWNKIFKKK